MNIETIAHNLEPRPRTSQDHSIAAMTHGLFIDERADYRELRRDSYGYAEKLCWIPISNRHTSWTFTGQRYGRQP